MPDVLQEFLNAGLLDIGEDDSRLERLRTASAELTDELVKSPRIALYHVLVAATEDASPDDEVFEEIAKPVENHWNTYRNRFKDTPRQLFKAVSLQSIESLSQKAPDSTKFAIGYVAQCVIPNVVGGREGQIIGRVLSSFADELERAASATWATSPTGLASTKAWQASKIGKFDRAKLVEQLLATLGPNNAQGQAIPSANPYWPNSNQAWSIEVSNRLAEIIASVAESAANQVLAEVAKSGNVQLDTVRSNVGELYGELEALIRQNRLLWWRHTLYSPAIGKAYKELPVASAVIQMALDMHGILEGIAPISAQFLLQNAVNFLYPNAQEVSLEELFSAATAESRATLLRFRRLVLARNGVRPLLERLIEVADGRVEGATGRSVAQRGESTASQIASRLLQEIQAMSLTATEVRKPAEASA